MDSKDQVTRYAPFRAGDAFMAISFLALFVMQLLVGDTRGDNGLIEVERTSRVVAATIQFAFLLCGYAFLFAKEMLGKRVFLVHRKATPAFLLLGMWVCVAASAMFSGFVQRNEATYVVGDFYKFCLLPLLFLLAYFGLRTRKQLDTVIRGIIMVMGVALIVNFIQMFNWVFEYGGRFSTGVTYHIGTILPFLLYLILSRQGSHFFRGLLWIVTLEICISIVLVQGFWDYISATVGLLLFSYYFRQKKLFLAVGLIALIAFFGVTDPFHLFAGEGTYAGKKLSYALSTSAGSDLAFVERLSGGRLGQVVGILQAFVSSPGHLPFGFGMGTFITMLPVTMVEIPRTQFTPWWQPYQHFIESGTFEVLYRTGLAGLGILLAFLFFCYRCGHRLLRGPHWDFGAFVMANTVYQFYNMSGETPFAYVWFFLVIPVVGTFALERFQVRQQEGTAASVREYLARNASQA